ncbi:Hypothetical predicted protein [Pelobates cultripes]|uniref:Uncharacterized protein n=1 Tax=Pelobates cultripes TaxID=61616 RepID=A0AAD1SXH6_PELCU|nr:Hypothetical predicted protein [Pelobates cultripes]
MGRTKRPDGSQTPRGHPNFSQTGPMDRYLASSAGASHEAAESNMADSPALPPASDTGGPSLADISADILALAASMVTKEDLKALSAVIRTEVTEIKADIATQAGRLQALETTVLSTTAQAETTNLAITRQGNMLLALRRQAEDLDNRGRRSNRVHGLPESAGEEDVEATLQTLFREILGTEAPESIEFDRAHRANRARAADNTPRDIVCCLHTYKLKEKIMTKARLRPTWRGRKRRDNSDYAETPHHEGHQPDDNWHRQNQRSNSWRACPPLSPATGLTQTDP